MSDDGKQHRSKEIFWAIPRGTVMCTPQEPVRMSAAEYQKRITAEALITDRAAAMPVPLQPAKRPHE